MEKYTLYLYLRCFLIKKLQLQHLLQELLLTDKPSKYFIRLTRLLCTKPQLCHHLFKFINITATIFTGLLRFLIHSHYFYLGVLPNYLFERHVTALRELE